MTPQPTRWFVFARKKADEPLAAIGELEAEQNGSPGVASAARTRYGDEWLEMIAIPRAAASWAIEEE
jgi:hypothetical protein